MLKGGGRKRRSGPTPTGDKGNDLFMKLGKEESLLSRRGLVKSRGRAQQTNNGGEKIFTMHQNLAEKAGGHYMKGESEINFLKQKVGKEKKKLLSGQGASASLGGVG